MDTPDSRGDFPSDGLTTREAALRLGVTPDTIRRAIKQGDLPAKKIGGIYVIDPAYVTRYPRQRGKSDASTRGVPLLPPLPTPLTSFIGRTAMLADLGMTLHQSNVHLLTLTGPGGVGKTRLAIAVAERQRSDFADGAGYIPLASIQDTGLVMPTIARYLGLSEGEHDSPMLRIQAYLGEMQCLLVLDNCEQVIGAGPAFAQLVEACPRLSLIVTSRAPLRVGGEHVFPVPPLHLPTGNARDDVVEAEASQLFLARAAAMRPGITVTDENAGAIRALCARLDGLPLAIELVAARANVMPPTGMLRHLDQRALLHTAGGNDHPARLRTLDRAIGWSYDLLTSIEQALFCRLAVFDGGFTLDAADAVASSEERRFAPPGPQPEGTRRCAGGGGRSSLLELLSVLVDQSLVQPVDGVGGEARFSMLTTIREFGLVQLAVRGEGQEIRERHARYFQSLAERVEPEFGGPDQGRWLRQFDFDAGNLRAALAWLIDAEDIEAALRGAAALHPYFEIRGYVSEARDWLERALVRSDSASATLRAHALRKLGHVQRELGEYAAARRAVEQSLALCKAANDQRGIAHGLDELGQVLTAEGNLARAQGCLEEALGRLRVIGEPSPVAVSLAGLGNVLLARGDSVRARTHHDEALAIWSRLKAPRESAYQLYHLAMVETSEHRPQAAWRHLTASLALFEDIGHQIGVAFVTHALGDAARDAGNLPAAAGYYRRAIALHMRLQNRRKVVAGIEQAIPLVVAQNPAVAARLLGMVDAFRKNECSPPPTMSSPSAEWGAVVSIAKNALGPTRFAAAWHVGQFRTIDAAAAEAGAALAHMADKHPSTPDMTGSAAVHPPPGAPSGLTPREVDVLRLLAAGKSNPEIAAELFLTVGTVKSYVHAIFAKLDVSSRAMAAVAAHQLGLA